MAMLRKAEIKDAQALAEIYGYYAKNTVVTFSTTCPTQQEYEEKIRHITAQYPFIVLAESGQILGFAYADRLRPHDAYLWDVELTIYLAPDAPKHQGYGRRLMEALMRVLAYQGYLGAYSVVTYPNEPSLGLHKALGFTQVGYFHKAGFKRGQWLDVAWLYKALGAFTSEPKAPQRFDTLDAGELEMLLTRENE